MSNICCAEYSPICKHRFYLYCFIFRYSMQLKEMREFLALLRILPSYEPRYTLMTLAHIGQACARIAVYNKKLVDKIIMR